MHTHLKKDTWPVQIYIYICDLSFLVVRLIVKIKTFSLAALQSARCFHHHSVFSQQAREVAPPLKRSFLVLTAESHFKGIQYACTPVLLLRQKVWQRCVRRYYESLFSASWSWYHSMVLSQYILDSSTSRILGMGDQKIFMDLKNRIMQY